MTLDKAAVLRAAERVYHPMAAPAVAPVAGAQDQPKHEGCLIYTLGKDTTAIGNYVLKGLDFSITVADLTGPAVVSTLSGTCFPNGELQRAEGSGYKPLMGKDSQLIYSYKLEYRQDTTFIETKRNNIVTIRKYPVKIMLANSLGGYTLVYMPAVLAAFAPTKKGDSILSNHIVFNSPRKFILKKTAEGNLIAGSSVMGMFTLYPDNNGNLQTVDGIGTSWNIKGVVVPPLNMDSVITSNLAKEQRHPHQPITNPLDSVQATIGQTNIKIKYSRPAVRGRVIFGEVVPWNRFWRTGADAATKISLTQPIWFNGKELPAGDYSIFTMPAQNGWTMMFNKKSDIWGTEYNPDNDVLRIPMLTQSLQEPAELVTFEINTTPGGGVIAISWEKLKAAVSFTTRAPGGGSMP